MSTIFMSNTDCLKLDPVRLMRDALKNLFQMNVFEGRIIFVSQSHGEACRNVRTWERRKTRFEHLHAWLVPSSGIPGI